MQAKDKDALAKYLKGLERTAADFDKAGPNIAQDTMRLRVSSAAIVLTVRFLEGIGADAYLVAPLMEAVEVLQGMIVPDSMPRERQERVYQAFAVKLQIECGLNEDRACRKVLGNNAPEAAARKLKNFIAALTRKSNPYPRESKLYSRLLAENKSLRAGEAMRDFDDYKRTQILAMRALAAYRQMRGDKEAGKLWRTIRDMLKV